MKCKRFIELIPAALRTTFGISVYITDICVTVRGNISILIFDWDLVNRNKSDYYRKLNISNDRIQIFVEAL